MRCGYCGRKLTDAALALGYCPSCGTHVASAPSAPQRGGSPGLFAATTTPSRPLIDPPAPPASAVRSAPFVPLPALSPPSPNASRTPTYPPPGTIARQPSQPMPGTRSATPSRPAPGIPPPSRPPVADLPSPRGAVNQRVPRRGGGALVVTVLALLLLAAVGGGTLYIAAAQGVGPLVGLVKAVKATATTAPTVTHAPTQTPQPTVTPTATIAPPTPTPLPTVPPAPAGYTTFTSADNAFGLDYPSLWTPGQSVQNGNTTYTFTSPNQTQVAQVLQTVSTISPGDIVSYLQNFVVNSNGTNYQTTQDATSYQNGTNAWTRAQATYTIAGASQSVIGLAINRGAHGYLVIYTAPTVSFDISSGSNFAEVVNSFTFLS